MHARWSHVQDGADQEGAGALHRTLEVRAAGLGQTLSDYLLAELERPAARPRVRRGWPDSTVESAWREDAPAAVVIRGARVGVIVVDASAFLEFLTQAWDPGLCRRGGSAGTSPYKWNPVPLIPVCHRQQSAGLSLIQMALASVVTHPALSAAIIGPRTMEHLVGYLTGTGVVLNDEILDRIDEIVPPGVDVAPLGGAAYTPPAIAQLTLRRRPAQDRGAA